MMRNWVEGSIADCGCDFSSMSVIGECLVGFKDTCSNTTVRGQCAHGKQWDAQSFWSSDEGTKIYDLRPAEGPCPNWDDF